VTQYRPAAEVGVIDRGDVVYVARLPQGPMIVLAGTAAVVWRAACTAGEGSVAQRAALDVDQDASAISTAVDEFLTDLVGRGLLAPIAD